MGHTPPAETLDGYRLLKWIGEGGFGQVWLCRSEAIGDLHALKFIPASRADRLEKEMDSLRRYRKATASMRSPYLTPVEHAGRIGSGLYYVMPLADGPDGADPLAADWQPVTLASLIAGRAGQPQWLGSAEITGLLRPVLLGLQSLSEAGLVHRDVKPENILFFGGAPCLADISLLGADAEAITRRGTPGYATPTWYAGGNPDMYGAAATLYTLLTGNAPDKMGRAAFLWPPQGEPSLPARERAEWKRLHAVVRRATEEKVAERYRDCGDFAAALEPSETGWKAAPRKRVAIAVAAAAAGLAAGLAIRWTPWTTPTPPPPAVTSAQPPAAPARPTEPAEPEFPPLTHSQEADYRALAGMIQGYIGEGEYADALATVDLLHKTYPQSQRQPAYSVARAMALKGLGRIEEAKEELRGEVHFLPEIGPMEARKKLWEGFGDLDSAEEDLTRILNRFGPHYFALFLRADVRAQKGNFEGVQADRASAYTIETEDPTGRRLVDALWNPLVTKYPGYAAYLKENPPPPLPPHPANARDSADDWREDADPATAPQDGTAEDSEK